MEEVLDLIHTQGLPLDEEAAIGPTVRAALAGGFTPEKVVAIQENLGADIIICLDEAYAEYIDDPLVPNGLKYAPLRHRLVVLRTFSKIYGLAGLRVAYRSEPPWPGHRRGAASLRRRAGRDSP